MPSSPPAWGAGIETDCAADVRHDMESPPAWGAGIETIADGTLVRHCGVAPRVGGGD